MHVEIEAYNTATASTNKIHDDRVARSYGFGGGLVPGVDVFAYLTQLPARQWGLEWLGGGSITARFVRPVYDGERISVAAVERTDDTMQLEVRGPDDAVRATASAHRGRSLGGTDRLPAAAPLPEERPPAGPDSLMPGTVLGTLHQSFGAEEASQYLADVREQVPLYTERGVAHPGWLLRRSNSILTANVVLGPWIHVSSDVSLHALVADGDDFDVRAVVIDEFERAGHRFVTLDVALVAADGTLVQRVEHTAIHTPRRVEG